MRNYIKLFNYFQCKNIFSQNLRILYITLIYYFHLMSLNLCDRTSISDITIIDQKDYKAFLYRRLAHKMSNLAKRIQKQKAQIKERRSQFQNMQSKFNILAQTAQQNMNKIESADKKNQRPTQKITPNLEFNALTQIEETKELKQDQEKSQQSLIQAGIKQRISIQKLGYEFEGKNLFKISFYNQFKKKSLEVSQKEEYKSRFVVNRLSMIKIEIFVSAIVFSMIICYLVRNSYSHI